MFGSCFVLDLAMWHNIRVVRYGNHRHLHSLNLLLQRITFSPSCKDMTEWWEQVHLEWIDKKVKPRQNIWIGQSLKCEQRKEFFLTKLLGNSGNLLWQHGHGHAITWILYWCHNHWNKLIDTSNPGVVLVQLRTFLITPTYCTRILV
jgi:hypothetical protein